MSWLKLNEGLNNLKGQISNFAINVLADEDKAEARDVNNYDYEQLKQLCEQQELRIEELKRRNRELTESNKSQHGQPLPSNGNWDWKITEQKTSVPMGNSSTDLRSTISILESEKNDLLMRLEQLDLENQVNLSKIVEMKDKVQEELNDVKENYLKLKQLNKNITVEKEKLKNELKELRQRLEPEKNYNTDIEEYKEKCSNLTEDNHKLKSELEELKKELVVKKSSNETLQKVLGDTKLASEVANLENNEKVKVLEGENKIIYTELQKVKGQILLFEKKSLEDEDNCQRLAAILEKYDKQVNSLKRELEESRAKCDSLEDIEDRLKLIQEEFERLKTDKERSVKQLEELEVIISNQQDQIESLSKENNVSKAENELLRMKANGRMDIELEDELEGIQREHEAQLGILQEELHMLKNQEAKNIIKEQRVDDLNDQIESFKREIADVKEQKEELDLMHKKVLLERHNQYINIITENIKKIQDCSTPSDLQYYHHKDDPQVAEFSKQVENIMKILLEFKFKCECLERKAIDLSEEKNNILAEKNHEIEKLLNNSEILSQEVLSKTQSLKDCENECSELAKNNDLLISDLEAYKNNSILQTISESNEDNVVLLESQLESANKRIEDLERIIDDLEKQPQESEALVGNDSDIVVKQLNFAEIEIVKKERDYQQLLNDFDLLHIERDTLNSDLEAARDYLQAVTEENRELKFTLEKMKTDFENTEYQLSELNFNAEGLKEELDFYKKKVDLLNQENDKLRAANEDYKRTSDDWKTKLIIAEEKVRIEEDARKEMEVQARNLKEKLQFSKMAETSLKLQYEQKSKEVLALSEARNNFEISLHKTNKDLAEFEKNFEELQLQHDSLLKTHQELKETDNKREEQMKNLEDFTKELESEPEKKVVDKNLGQLSVSKHSHDSEKLQGMSKNEEDVADSSETEKEQTLKGEMSESYNDLKLKFDELVKDKINLQVELDKQAQVLTKLNETCYMLQQQLQEVTNSRNELINVVTSKHQESVTYHNEIKRLNEILSIDSEKVRDFEETQMQNKEIEKLTDQNHFLKEKCEILTKNLLEEQSKVERLVSAKSVPSEKELALQKKLDRLQTHLVEIEEHYTQELLQSEQKNATLQAKMTEIEEREKSSSTMYTSVSIRANQQVEVLKSQLQAVTNERDSLRKQISDAEDQNSKHAAALANLQFVLEQFRKDKEKDVLKETERIRRHITAEKHVQEELKQEISNLKSQLEESNQGLLAASRLSDQLEQSKKTISILKEEVSQLQNKLWKTQEDLLNAISQTDGKVDKSLIKNLIIGFVASNNNFNKDQLQILKIIATVLDFNQQDHDKVKLNQPHQGSWLSAFLAPHPGNQSKISQESLSQAFIEFLENESKPKVVPSLLDASTSSESTRPASNKSSPTHSPIVLSEIVLPTFADFAQNRNSSSILKDVLKDSSS